MTKTKASEVTLSEKFMTLLRRYRLARGLTQVALAKKLDVVPSTVSFWESGDNVPKADMIPKLARILGIDAFELTRVIDPESAAPVREAR